MSALKIINCKAGLILLTLLSSFTSFAQDKKIDINVDLNKNGNWYAQPWVWVVGGAVFILLLVAIVKSNNSKS